MMETSCLIFAVIVACLVFISPDDAESVKREGHWGPWGALSPCSVTCGSGIASMERVWIPGPDEAPSKIPWTSTQVYSCTDETYLECPQNGTWSTWGVWSGCTKVCGGGMRERHRDCRGQMHGGRPCEGEKYSKEDCNKTPCPPLPKNFDMTQCRDDTNFTCVSQKMCIPLSEKCDTTVQCHDGTDEEDCPSIRNWGEVRYDLNSNQPTYSSYSVCLTVLLVIVANMLLVNH